MPALTHHETEVCPLAEEVAVYIDAIRLAQILRNEGPYGWEVLLLQVVRVLDVLELRGQGRFRRGDVRRGHSAGETEHLGHVATSDRWVESGSGGSGQGHGLAGGHESRVSVCKRGSRRERCGDCPEHSARRVMEVREGKMVATRGCDRLILGCRFGAETYMG